MGWRILFGGIMAALSIARRTPSHTHYRRSTRGRRVLGRAVLDACEQRMMLCTGHGPGCTCPGCAGNADGMMQMPDGGMSCHMQTHADPSGPEYVLHNDKWSFNDISWSYSNLLDGGLTLASDTTLADIQRMTTEALGIWTAVSPLILRQRVDSGPAPSDNSYPAVPHPIVRIGHHFMDGAPMTGLDELAHAQFPMDDGFGGDMHFDSGNTWGRGGGAGGTNFAEVAAHELGHALGLRHPNGDTVGNTCPAPKPALMDACLQGRFAGSGTAFLMADDIAGIQAQYGAGLGYLIDLTGVAHFYGTGQGVNTTGNDTFTISNQAINGLPNYVITSNYGSRTIPLSQISGLQIHSMGGNDVINIEGTYQGVPVWVDAGPGDDLVHFSPGARQLWNLARNVLVEGGPGNDHIFAFDDNQTLPSTYTIDFATFSSNRWAGFGYYPDVEGLTLWTGLASDVVQVNNTYEGQPVFLNSRGGTDAVTVGSSGGTGAIRGDLQIANTYSFSTVVIDDSGSTGAKTWTIGRNGNYSVVQGLSPANIILNDADVSSRTIKTGSGTNNGTVNASRSSLTISKSGGSTVDSVRVGRFASGGGLTDIFGPVIINPTAGSTDLVVSDWGDSLARTFNIATAPGSRYRVSPNMSGYVEYAQSSVRNFTLETSFQGDTVNVTELAMNSPTGKALILNSNGVDTINVGGPLGLNSIAVPRFEVDSPSSVARVTLNNTGNGFAITNAIVRTSGAFQTLENVNFFGSVFAWRRSAFSSITDECRYVGNAIAGTLNVHRLISSFRFEGWAATQVNIGSDTVEPDVLADLMLVNAPNYNSIKVNLAARSAVQDLNFSVVTLGDGLPYGRVNGVTLGSSSSILYRMLDSRAVTVVGGSGGDTFRVVSTAGSGLAFQGGNGNDRFSLGNPPVIGAPESIADLLGPVSIDGGGGQDTLFVFDDATAGAYQIDNTTLTGPNGVVHNFSSIDRVSAIANPAGSTFDVYGGDNVTLVSGAGTDYFNIYDTVAGSYVWIEAASDGSTGYDFIDADVNNSAEARVAVRGGYYGNISARSNGLVNFGNCVGPILTAGVSVSGNGRVDIADVGMIYEYAGTSPVNDINALVASGYANGSQSGAGIVSGSSVLNGHRVGVIESLAALGPGVTEWLGRQFSGPALLVRSTLAGDATLDRVTNFSDLLILAANYNLTTDRLWMMGDFDYDNATGFDDLLLLAANYNQSIVGAPAAPPVAAPPPSEDEQSDGGPVGNEILA
jgi:hypothetical protein